MSAGRLRFSLRLNNDLPVADYVALAQAAELAGFDQFWVSNDLFLRSAPVILGAVALATRTLEIGTCILNPYTMHPAEIAMAAATLDEVSGGRFNLGLAAGAAEFLEWVGVAQTRPLAAMRETITVVRRLLRGERVALQGEFLRWTDEAYLRFRPARVPPIYLGAMSPGMLRLAGELADGALPLLFPPEHFLGVRPLIMDGATNRDPALGDIDLAACVWVSVGADAGAARKALARKVAYYGSALSPLIYARLGVDRAEFEPIAHALTNDRDEDRAVGLVDDRMLAIGIQGSVADVVARLKPLVAAGARHLSFGPPLGPDPRSAIAMLGREALPALRDE